MTWWQAILLGFGIAITLNARAMAASDRRWRDSQIAGIDRAVLLDAIAEGETHNNPRAIGSKGERGRCQFMPGSWRMHTRLPFTMASADNATTREIERKHFAWVCDELLARGHPLDPALIAAAWRFGPGRAAENVRAESAQYIANTYWKAKEARP